MRESSNQTISELRAELDSIRSDWDGTSDEGAESFYIADEALELLDKLDNLLIKLII